MSLFYLHVLQKLKSRKCLLILCTLLSRFLMCKMCCYLYDVETPMGTLPLMTVGPEQIVTSLAMLTYLGGEAGLCALTCCLPSTNQRFYNPLNFSTNYMYLPSNYKKSVWIVNT